MSDLLRIQNLEKRYDDFDLEGISLSVLAGSVVGFIGSNGAGKTTTIKAILGLIRPDGGSISLFGEEVTGAPERRLAQLKQRIGVVFDTCSFPEELTVSTVSSLMAQSYKDWNPGAFRTFAHAFQLPQDKTVKDLSRGMGMKLSLACALAHNPDLLVLDEATAFADPENEALIQRALARLCEGKTVLMIAHRLSTVIGADIICVLDGGRVVERGRHDELVAAGGLYAKMWNDYRTSVTWRIEGSGTHAA